MIEMAKKADIRKKIYDMNMSYEHVVRKGEQLRTGSDPGRGAKEGLGDTDVMDRAGKETREMARKTGTTDEDEDPAILDVIHGILLVLEDILDDRLKSAE